jgi:hypothetical protein
MESFSNTQDLIQAYFTLLGETDLKANAGSCPDGNREEDWYQGAIPSPQLGRLFNYFGIVQGESGQWLVWTDTRSIRLKIIHEYGEFGDWRYIYGLWKQWSSTP